MADLQKQFSGLVYDIAEEMESHGYFLGSEELPGRGKKRFLRHVLERRLSEAQVPHALYKLTKIIEKLTKRKTIVLIDEYDTPTSISFQHDYFLEVCP